MSRAPGLQDPTRTRNRRGLVVTIAFLLAIGVLAMPAARGGGQNIGDTTVFASIPDPGYPEGIAVDANTVYVTGPANVQGLVLEAQDEVQIWRFDLVTGAPRESIPVAPEGSAPTSAAGLVLDAAGRLYVVFAQPFGVVRIDPAGSQELYATLPDLPPCGAAAPEPPDCSPGRLDRPPFPNDLAFDADGNLYVTDMYQATIWRVSPRGELRAWFQHDALAQSFGPGGVRVGPDGRTLYFAVTAGGLQPQHPVGIYTLPLVDDPAAADLQLFAEIGGVDGMAFGASGLLYAVAKGDNQVVAFNPDGTEALRFPDAIQNLEQEVPFDAPATLAFRDATRSILVTNHAMWGTGVILPERFAVLESFVDDTGLPLARPTLPEKHGRSRCSRRCRTIVP